MIKPQLLSMLYLEERKIPYEHRSFSLATEKGAANVAHALGFVERQMVKTLLFETDKQETVLIMVGGDQNAISGHLKKILNSRNVSMCSRDKVKAITSYEVGSIPPFHWQPPGFRSFLDVSLLKEPVLGVGTGEWGQEILIQPKHLIEATQAHLVNLTHRDLPPILENLFSYGTLRYEKVQIATFGRKLEGYDDVLPGYQLKKLQITDPDVIAKSGEETHSIIHFSGDLKDQVPGMVFSVSSDELHRADKYEVADYKRIQVKLNSGISAWVYVSVKGC